MQLLFASEDLGFLGSLKFIIYVIRFHPKVISYIQTFLSMLPFIVDRLNSLLIYRMIFVYWSLLDTTKVQAFEFKFICSLYGISL